MDKKWFLSLTVLVLASLACSAILPPAAATMPVVASETPSRTPRPTFVVMPTPQVHPLPSLIPPTATNTSQPTNTPITGIPTESLYAYPTEEVLPGDDIASRILLNVTYCTADNVPLLADIYFPANRTGEMPLLIFIHGGAWYSGDKVDITQMFEMPILLNSGFALASINYRLAPDYQMPTMIEDVKCAVRSFRANAAKYKLDPERIGVWGVSAGGHLAAMLGVTDSSAGFDVGEYFNTSSEVQCVVDMFGPADLTSPDLKKLLHEFSSAVFNTNNLSAPIFSLVSPVRYISSDDPPFLILQGDLDRVVPLSQSVEFYKKLITAGVEAKLVIVKGGDHGFSMINERPSRSEIAQLVVNFFAEQLRQR